MTISFTSFKDLEHGINRHPDQLSPCPPLILPWVSGFLIVFVRSKTRNTVGWYVYIPHTLTRLKSLVLIVIRFYAYYESIVFNKILKKDKKRKHLYNILTINSCKDKTKYKYSVCKY